MPGAVPAGFSILTGPAGTSACWRFDGDIVLPMRAKRRSSAASRPASRSSGRPVAAATPSRVRSSWVGPRPPQTTTTPARPSAALSTRSIWPTSSPTAVCRVTGTPTLARASEMNLALVSAICPARISDPTETTSAFNRPSTGCRGGRRRRTRCRARRGRPEGGHDRATALAGRWHRRGGVRRERRVALGDDVAAGLPGLPEGAEVLAVEAHLHRAEVGDLQLEQVHRRERPRHALLHRALERDELRGRVAGDDAHPGAGPGDRYHELHAVEAPDHGRG